MNTKYCPSCSKTLPVDCFGIGNSRKDGLNPYCKPCQKDKSHESKARRKEAIALENRLYRERTDYDKKYYEANREAKLTKGKLYYESIKADPEKLERWRSKNREWFRSLKKQCVDYLGGKCRSCGFDQYIAALDFHHIDPEGKDFTIGGKGRKFERIRAELDKCILLCSNCHRAIHSGELSI